LRCSIWRVRPLVGSMRIIFRSHAPRSEAYGGQGRYGPPRIRGSLWPPECLSLPGRPKTRDSICVTPGCAAIDRRAERHARRARGHHRVNSAPDRANKRNIERRAHRFVSLLTSQRPSGHLRLRPAQPPGADGHAGFRLPIPARRQRQHHLADRVDQPDQPHHGVYLRRHRPAQPGERHRRSGQCRRLSQLCSRSCRK
jgi:hypothetical protein